MPISKNNQILKDLPFGPMVWVDPIMFVLSYLNFKSNFFFWFPFSCPHFFLYLLKEGDFNEIKGLFLLKFMHFDPSKQGSIGNSKSWKEFFFLFLNKNYMDAHKFAHIYTPRHLNNFISSFRLKWMWMKSFTLTLCYLHLHGEYI
jgi:hypothetical protein